MLYNHMSNSFMLRNIHTNTVGKLIVKVNTDIVETYHVLFVVLRDFKRVPALVHKSDSTDIIHIRER